MEITLKKLVEHKALSEETNAFSTDVFVNGLKAGQAQNTGKGGETTIQPYNDKGRQLLKEADAFFRKLSSNQDGASEKINQRGLIDLIDDLVYKTLVERDNAQAMRKIEKVMPNAIVFGSLDTEIFQYPHKIPLAEALKRQGGPELIAAKLQEIQSKALPGQMLFNTNLPPEIIPEGMKTAVALKTQKTERVQKPIDPKKKGPHK